MVAVPNLVELCKNAAHSYELLIRRPIFLIMTSIFLPEPDDFLYAGCENDTAWTCYFEPLSNCSYHTHTLPILDASPSGKKI